MGDRVLFQVIGKPERISHDSTKTRKIISPVAYGHWSGALAPAICTRLKARMHSRGADVAYTFARLMQEMIGDREGNLSFGAWNHNKPLTAKDSHGDAGVVLIRYDKGEYMAFECLGGYLKVDESGDVVSTE